MVGFAWGPLAEQQAPVYFRSDSGVWKGAEPNPPVDLQADGIVQWRTELGSGDSSPIRVDDRLFLTTYQPGAAGGGGGLATVAIDARTGAILWRRTVPVPGVEPFHRTSGSPAASTPAWDGQRLVVFFGSYGLQAFDRDGALKWERRIGPFQDEYGAASSPVVHGGLVVLQEDHDLGSFLLGIRAETGEEVWRTPRPDAVRSYSSPAVWNREGRSELLVAGALELAGYDPVNGRRLWASGGLARIVIPVPVAVGGRVYMASWAPGGDAGRRLTLGSWGDAVSKWDKNGDGKLSRGEVDNPEVLDRFFRMDLNQDGMLEQGEWERHAAFFEKAQNSILCLESKGRGVEARMEVVWSYAKGVPYVPSPVVTGGRVWMVKDGGIVTRLDAATGALIGDERLSAQGGYYASPVAGGKAVYFASEAGVVSVVSDGEGWAVISSRNFGERIHATPLLDSGRLFVRTEKALYALVRRGL